jgi:hypothetical protein
MTDPADARLREDFEVMRRNSAARAPATIEDLISFLMSAEIFHPTAARRRPMDSGQCKL